MENEAGFFDVIREHLSGDLSQSQVDGFNTILDKWASTNITNDHWLAYALATTWHETARTMQPISEYGGRSYLQSKPYYPYYGRGYVQLTWRQNYVHYGFEANPSLALVPENAAHVMIDGMVNGIFTGKKLGDYFSATHSDAINARRIINGTDKAVQIASYYNVFVTALLEMRDGVQDVA